MENQLITKLSDYTPYPFLIPKINIDFDIYNDKVVVESIMIVEPRTEKASKLFLNGSHIELDSICINGRELESEEYHLSKGNLIIYQPPLCVFELKIRSSINPFKNTSLQGLYLSSGMLTTQCEAEGFRHICFHPDRPDILSIYTVRIEADCLAYPILLSNGNRKGSGRIKNNPDRHEVLWEDPFPKPSYLFALVAGKLKKISDTYKTYSGKIIDIQIYVEDGDENYTKHAINSLKKAMEWDEDKFGLEYDLDEYKIVAVRHFNMGAMENKGLNIFNSKLVLADSLMATDYELERIESVIAHEYFHNWTGNRVTCRDWFQLSLKEGLTVYRDQSFTSDLHNSALKRIEDVSMLRNFQFAEDSGPTSHAVKPKEYVSIDNFYTTTIYEKGAELIRMLELLLGKERFIEGVKLYIETFDGFAATTEDFIDSVIKGACSDCQAPTFDVNQFQNWYYQSGTPKVSVNQHWDKTNSILTVSFEQQLKDDTNDSNIEMVIPILFSCYDKEKKSDPLVNNRLFILDKSKKVLRIKGLKGNDNQPVLSLFRGFSSPIDYKCDLNKDDYLFLFSNDNDYFSRWDSGQILMRQIINHRISNNPDFDLENCFINSLEQFIVNLRIKESSFLSSLLTIPGLSELERSQTVVNPSAINHACLSFRCSMGLRLFESLKTLLHEVRTNIYQTWPEGQGGRKLTETIWSLFVLAGDNEVKRDCVKAVNKSSMTLARAGLNALKQIDCLEAEEASNLFFEKWKDNPVVLDAWFSYEASRSNVNVIEVVQKLLSHPKFDWMAPNSIRAVLGGFTKNIESFHASNGQGYMFFAEKLIEVDKINPITASRMAKVFCKWKTYIDPNKIEMYKAILKVNEAKISTNTREVLELILD